MRKGGDNMAKKGEARENITLVCSDCKSENYRTEKIQKKYNRAFKIKKTLS